MPEHPERKSAVIYTFTPRPRGGLADVRNRDRVTPTPNTGFPTAPCGSGWYHDAAIRENAPDRKP